MGLENKEVEPQLRDSLPSQVALFKALNHWTSVPSSREANTFFES